MAIPEVPVGPSNTTFTDHVTSDSKLPTYPQYGSHMYVLLSYIYCHLYIEHSNICFGSQPHPEQQPIQPQMTGLGSAYSSAPPQGFAPQQIQEAPANFAAPAVQFYSAVPLANLGEASAPADCPMCRHRTMTLTNSQVGNTTQYVFCNFTFHITSLIKRLVFHIACAPSVSVWLPASDFFPT